MFAAFSSRLAFSCSRGLWVFFPIFYNLTQTRLLPAARIPGQGGPRLPLVSGFPYPCLRVATMMRRPRQDRRKLGRIKWGLASAVQLSLSMCARWPATRREANKKETHYHEPTRTPNRSLGRRRTAIQATTATQWGRDDLV